jgi:hypothetical protein
MVGTKKMRSHSESRGDHIGGVQFQQNLLGGDRKVFSITGCSFRRGVQ